jgi:hypothetical protein
MMADTTRILNAVDALEALFERDAGQFRLDAIKNRAWHILDDRRGNAETHHQDENGDEDGAGFPEQMAQQKDDVLSGR